MHSWAASICPDGKCSTIKYTVSVFADCRVFSTFQKALSALLSLSQKYPKLPYNAYVAQGFKIVFHRSSFNLLIFKYPSDLLKQTEYSNQMLTYICNMEGYTRDVKSAMTPLIWFHLRLQLSNILESRWKDDFFID